MEEGQQVAFHRNYERHTSKRYAKEQAEIEVFEAQIAALQQQIEELAEEHSSEGGLLEEARNDKDKLTKASAAARLKDIKSDKDAAEERKVLKEYVALSEQETEVSGELKMTQDGLMVKVAAKYAQLTEDDFKTPVVDDKWLATLADAVQGELGRVSQTLTGRIRQLSEAGWQLITFLNFTDSMIVGRKSLQLSRQRREDAVDHMMISKVAIVDD